MAIVNIGDTVQVTVQADQAVAGLLDNNVEELRQRLQDQGFRVVGAINDSGVGYIALGGRGSLIVVVQPITSAYGSENDVGSIVAGAAYEVGYQTGPYSAYIVQRAEPSYSGYETVDAGPGYSSPWRGYSQPPANTYLGNRNEQEPPPPPGPPNSLSDALNKLGAGLGAGSVVTVAVIVIGAIVLLKR